MKNISQRVHQKRKLGILKIACLSSLFFMTGCGSHFAADTLKSEPKTVQITPPESTFQDRTYRLALDQREKATLVDPDSLANTKYRLIGIQSKLLTTDNKGLTEDLLPESDVLVSFSDFQPDECPEGMLCTPLEYKLSNLRIKTSCQEVTAKSQLILTRDIDFNIISNATFAYQSGLNEQCKSALDSQISQLSTSSYSDQLLISRHENFFYMDSQTGVTLVLQKIE
jgi:hypothetical protein